MGQVWKQDGPEWRAELRDHEHHANGRTVLRLREPRGAAAHKQRDPQREQVKARLRDAAKTLVRLDAERESGADLRAAVAPLRLKTFCEILTRNHESTDRRIHRVSDADLERLEEVITWLEALKSPAERAILLEWARGNDWRSMAADQSVSQSTLWRRFDRALGRLVSHLKAKNYFSS